MFAHLNVHSWFSFLRGASSPKSFAEAAARRGCTALALTDFHGVYGVVRHFAACAEVGIKPIIGAELVVDDYPVVLLVRNEHGFQSLNKLLTRAHLADRDHPSVSFETFSGIARNLICLTGGRESLFFNAVFRRDYQRAFNWLSSLSEIFPDHLYVQLFHQFTPDDRRYVHHARRIARLAGVPCIAAPPVYHVDEDDYAVHDMLTCIRHNISVFDPHPDRPANDQAYLIGEDELRRRIPDPAAFDAIERVVEACTFNPIPDRIIPPQAIIPKGWTARSLLRHYCNESLPRLYPPETRDRARQQLEKELQIIERLDLSEFFLVVKEVIDEANRRGIRCAGRGSAANSIVSYLLDVTAVDPIAHNLLFERFLHDDRKGTPDIDVDFDSSRRDEIIQWMESRFGISHTAMSGTLVTYQLRSALRDVAKALGYPLQKIDELAKHIPRRRARHVSEYRPELARILGSSPLLGQLISMVERIDNCPRHMGLHSGGMILSRTPLYAFSPVQVSANGVRMVQFDKHDIEALGLVKFDVLGLRMLATLSFAEKLIYRAHGKFLDWTRIPLDDAPTFNLIRSGKAVGLFQIESQGQLHLLGQLQPERFDDLISEVAIFRPGPVQSGMVQPYVKRRRGKEPIRYLHPTLKSVLQDTYGVILFQEQVLQIAHAFAGMSLSEADNFRILMSKFRDPEEMESMRGAFVSGAIHNGVSEEVAHKVFDQVSKFVGYGFCRSHAAAFAKTVYQSAYLKAHYTAAFMAAVMEHRPGMYALSTLEQEARRFRIEIGLPDINRSGIAYGIVPKKSRWMIIKPLTSIELVSEDHARKIVWTRLDGPFKSIEDFWSRVDIPKDVFFALARSGAFDHLEKDSRTALWKAGVLVNQLRSQPPGLFSSVTAVLPEFLIPDLPSLSTAERIYWDIKTHRSGRTHPMTLVRDSLQQLEIRPIAQAVNVPAAIRKRNREMTTTLSGIVILRQRPPTANGFMFVTLEDETGFVQVVVNPALYDTFSHVLSTPALIVRGKVQYAGNWRGVVLQEAWQLDGIFGGYSGQASDSGGRDRWLKWVEKWQAESERALHSFRQSA